MTTGLLIAWLAGCGGAPDKPQPTPVPPAADQTQALAQPSAEQSPAPEATAQTPSPTQDAATPQPQTPSDVELGLGQPGSTTPVSGSVAAETQGPGEPANRPAETPKRPEDLADWKQEDFLSAKRDGDPRLLEAVRLLGTKHVGDDSIVEILVTLLRPTPPEAPNAPGSPAEPAGGPGPSPYAPQSGGFSVGGYGNTPGMGQPNPSLIAVAIRALVTNDTDQARTVLRNIVAGALTTDDDRTATPPAMRALVEHPTPENDALILRALVKPDKLRKDPSAAAPGASQPAPAMPGRGGGSGQTLSAEELHTHAKQLVDALAPESFRIRLVEYLLSSKATAKQREELVPMLAKPRAENVAAQLRIYQAPVPAVQLKADFEKHFAELSSVALGHVLGALADKEPEPELPATPGSGGSDGGWGRIKAGGSDMGEGGIPMGPMGQGIGLGGGDLLGGEPPKIDLHNPEVIYPLAKKLWDAKAVTAVIQRCEKAVPGQQNNAALALARSMPVDRVRAALYRLLAERFKDGPVQIFGSGELGGDPLSSTIGYGGGMRFGELLGTPGDPNAPKTFFDPGLLVVVKSLPLPVEKPQRSGTAKRGVSPPGFSGVEEGLGAPGGGDESTSPDEQWGEAAKNLALVLCQQCRAAAESPPEDSKALTKIPIKVPARANVVAYYHVKWPDDAAGKLSGFPLDSLEVHYWRIEEEAQFSRVEKRFRSQLNRPKQRQIAQTALWFDSVRDGEEPGSRLSRDVIVTRSQGFPTPDAALGRGRQREPSEPLVIEALSIEMKDPTGTAKAAE